MDPSTHTTLSHIDVYFSDSDDGDALERSAQRRRAAALADRPPQRPQPPPQPQPEACTDTRLYALCLKGDLRRARKLLLPTGGRAAAVVRGSHALHAACLGAHADVAAYLVGVAGPRVLACVEPEQRRTPLHCVLGAALDREEEEALSPHAAAASPPSPRGSSGGGGDSGERVADVVSVLLGHVAPADPVLLLELLSAQDLFGRTPLYTAAAASQHAALARLLAALDSVPRTLDTSRAVNVRANTGRAPLHLASRQAGCPRAVLESLVEHACGVAGHNAGRLPAWRRLKDRVAGRGTARKAACGGGETEDALPTTADDRDAASESSSDVATETGCVRRAGGGADDGSLSAASTPPSPPSELHSEAEEEVHVEVEMEGGPSRVCGEPLLACDRSGEPALCPVVARELLVTTTKKGVALAILAAAEASQDAAGGSVNNGGVGDVGSDSDSNATAIAPFHIRIDADDVEGVLEREGTAWMDILDRMVKTSERVQYLRRSVMAVFSGVLVCVDELSDYSVAVQLLARGSYGWALVSIAILVVSQVVVFVCLRRMRGDPKYSHAFRYVPPHNAKLLPCVFEAVVFYRTAVELWAVTDLSKAKSLEGLTTSLAFLEGLTESAPQAALQLGIYLGTSEGERGDARLLYTSLVISCACVVKNAVTYAAFKCSTRSNILGILKSTP
eukprot:Rhum_TRINITY_DN14713_c15_g1::Rhum_TRINITY_DN14713_c15_g1_i1::g.111522::m.111522